MNRYARFLTILFAAVVSAQAVGAPTDRRTTLGAMKTQVLSAIVSTLYPQAQIAWLDRITITLPDGATSVVRVKGTAIVPAASGSIVVMAVDFPDFQVAASDQLAAFAEPASWPLDALGLFQLDGAGQITSETITRADTTAVMNEVKELRLNEADEDGPATIEISYWSTYRAPDWVGSIRWSSVLDAASLTRYARLPLSMNKTTRGGGSVEDIVSLVRTSDVVLHVKGPITEREFDWACATPCLFDGTSLLAAW